MVKDKAQDIYVALKTGTLYPELYSHLAKDS